MPERKLRLFSYLCSDFPADDLQPVRFHVAGEAEDPDARFRCPVSIIGTTTNERAWRKLNLSWGVFPVLTENYSSIDVMFWQDMKIAQEVCSLEKGDNVVLTGGLINGEPGNTNIIKVESVK